MKTKERRKDGSDVNWLCKFVLLFLLIVVELLDGYQVEAQTYCEESPKILFYRRGQAEMISGGGANESSHHVVVSNVNKEFLACVSSRNVEWTYDGEGEPSKFQESSTVDIQKYDDGSISYCLTSQITFSNKQSDTELSKHTGKYSCREIGNISNSASVYVFASRKNSPTFVQSRKTLTFPLSQENVTLHQPIPSTISTASDGRKANGSTGSSDDDAEINKIFTIPCVTTHPNVSVKLLKKGINNKFMVYNGASYQFDHKLGFLVNASRKSSEQFADFHGEYKCVSSTSSRRGHSHAGGEYSKHSKMDVEDFVFINLVKAKAFQIYPPVNEVFTSGMLNLTCESEEPVIMKEVLPSSAQDVYSYLDDDDYGRDRSDDIVETTERTDQKSHIANYMEIAPAPGRFGEIQCLTEKDGKVLHTWRYKIIRKRADKLSGIKFNKREKSFTCKSKLGAPGRLSFISCRTPSECRINKICLSKSENCRGYSNSTRAFCERKSHFCGKIFYKGGSGLIRCIGEGIDEIRGFTDEASVDHAVRMGFGKLKASETALLELDRIVAADTKNNGNNNPDQPTKLEKQQTQKENEKLEGGGSTIYEGELVNVALHMGYYYFLYPVQWAVKFKNGSTIQISPDLQSLQVNKLSRTVHASLTLPYTTATSFLKYKAGEDNSSQTSNLDAQPQPSEITALHALIPLRASVDPSWKTISLPLTVFGKQGLPQPSLDIESEEVLIEPPLYQEQHDNNTLFSGNTTAVEKEEAFIADNTGENDENDYNEEDSPTASRNQEPEPTTHTPTVDTAFNETDSQKIKSNNSLEITTKQSSNASECNDNNCKVIPEKGDVDSTGGKTLGEDAITTVPNLQRNDLTTKSNASNENGTENSVSRPIVNSHNGSINNATERPLSPSSVEQASNTTSADFTTGGLAESSSRDTKFDESNQSGGSAFVEKIMIQEESQPHNEDNGLLARSGLLFDDEIHPSENTDKESGVVTDANVEDENSIIPTTEIPSLVIKVAYDENNSDDPYTTENPATGEEIELETFTTPSPHIL